MRKSDFTQEQIAFTLRQAEAGTTVDEICRTLGLTQATFYMWKKKYAGKGVSELRRLTTFLEGASYGNDHTARHRQGQPV